MEVGEWLRVVGGVVGLGELGRLVQNLLEPGLKFVD